MLLWVFLIVVGILWLIIGSIQDLKTKEVANWISFSLLAIGFAVRVFFSLSENDWNILFCGIVSTAVLFIVAFAFYYTKVFAGGDTKLLIGLGPFIPGSYFYSVLTNSLFAVLILLFVGAVYSLIASFFVVFRRKKDFMFYFRKHGRMYYFIIPLIILLWIIFYIFPIKQGILVVSATSLAILFYPYLRCIDKCMTRKYKSNELTPGDWLAEDIRIGRKTIHSTVHGLSEKDISLIKKAHKTVLIKEGVPFVPAFLLSFIAMVFFFVLLGQDFVLMILQKIF